MLEWQGYLGEILRWLEDAIALDENVATIIYKYSGSADGLLLHTSSKISIYLNIDEDNSRKAALAIISVGELDRGILGIEVYKPSTHHLATSMGYSCGEEEFSYTIEMREDAQRLAFVVDDPCGTYTAEEHSRTGKVVAELLCDAVALLNADGDLYAVLTKLLAESVKEIIEDEIATSFGN